MLDVEDEFYTLRERWDYVIAGGANGDCPATVGNAAALAVTLLEAGASAIVQLNDLALPERRRFIRVFLEAMIGAPRALWHPTIVVLDEADRYAPQDGSAESLSAVVALMAQGRKRGYTGVLATQRLAKIAKGCGRATSTTGLWAPSASQPIAARSPTRSASVRRARRRAGSSAWNRVLSGRSVRRLLPNTVLVKVGDVSTTHLRSGQRDVPTPPARGALEALLARLRCASEDGEEKVKGIAARGDIASSATGVAPRARGARGGVTGGPLARNPEDRGAEIVALQARVAALDVELAKAEADRDAVRRELEQLQRRVADAAAALGVVKAERSTTARRPKRSRMTQARTARARALLADRANTVEDVARLLGVSPATLYRALPGGRGAVTGRSH